jgi:hypothetical protein
VTGVKFSPDRSLYAMRIADKEVKVHDARTGAIVTARSCRGGAYVECNVFALRVCVCLAACAAAPVAAAVDSCGRWPRCSTPDRAALYVLASAPAHLGHKCWI